MRHLLAAIAVTALAVASQSSAEAILLDNFSEPGGTQTAAPGGDTVGLTGASSAVATARTLTGSAPPSAALKAGTGNGSKLNVQLGNQFGNVASVMYDLPLLAMGPASVSLIGFKGTSSPTSSVLVKVFTLSGGAVNEQLNGDITYTVSDGVTNLDFVGVLGSNFDGVLIEFSVDPGEIFAGFATSSQIQAAPEPATMALMGLGVLGGAFGYRRRRKDDEVVPTSAA